MAKNQLSDLIWRSQSVFSATGGPPGILFTTLPNHSQSQLPKGGVWPQGEYGKQE